MATTPRFHVVEADLGDGSRLLVTVLPPEDLFIKGLRSEAVVGTLDGLGPDGGFDPSRFHPNPLFVEHLHGLVARLGHAQKDYLLSLDQAGNGWAFVWDQRTDDPEGPVPPEDILGVFEVRNGTVAGGTYRPNPNHRLLTEQGFFQLPEELHDKLVAEMDS